MQHLSSIAFLFAALHILLSITVTVHVLLTKRETTAATGWIGICWFMPYVGSLLYLFFGINRVRRRAQKLMDDEPPEFSNHHLINLESKGLENLRPLGLMLDQLSEQPLLGGNSVTCLHDGDNVYPLMLEAIAQAQRSILLCSYIFRNDTVGEKFVQALVAAQQRGVEIRVLVDGVGNGYFYSGIQSRLRREGIMCARFMHSFLPWRMPFVNLRNHRKILVVDGLIGFMGGLNIGAENILAQHDDARRMPVSDTHFCLKGPIVRQLAETFVHDWFFTTDESLEGERYFPVPKLCGNVPARVVTSGPDADVEKIEYTILQAIILARRHVCFMTPYFLPDNRLATELGLAALRGIRIDVVVPRRSNHAPIDHARDAGLYRLVEVGCHVWMGNPPFNHSKLMTVDGEWSFVGSANLDRRSLRLNFEVNVELHDKETATHLEEFMKQHWHHEVTLVELVSLPLWKKLRNAALRLFLPYL
ncbi:cardiolipin synthase [Saccharibacter sp. 17.LH.SD]|uniref:phospholipase D-like domain-containing protein n=1 Tax=Saccharibacter sp. 17.LH.SD TaxID=2689393 RepID=UPI00136CA488|nr:phospholipase D-like domain-containing protein [Saccharibacter sp. 17.LH.SD]MXV44214.1 cardiolipin synthase [Saccharibacter sp. 17.LH.SD]